MQEESLSIGKSKLSTFDLVILPLGAHHMDRREKDKRFLYKVICSGIRWSSKNGKRHMISPHKQIMAHQIDEILSSYEKYSCEGKISKILGKIK